MANWPWATELAAAFHDIVSGSNGYRATAGYDLATVRELTMSASLATKTGYRLDWTGTWNLETDAPFYSPDDPAPLLNGHR